MTMSAVLNSASASSTPIPVSFKTLNTTTTLYLNRQNPRLAVRKVESEAETRMHCNQKYIFYI
jgi:hypothetical protein